jgi:hypothetical protein
MLPGLTQGVATIIKGLQASGISTLTGLAAALNERGIQTPQGRRWHPMTVKRGSRRGPEAEALLAPELDGRV